LLKRLILSCIILMLGYAAFVHMQVHFFPKKFSPKKSKTETSTASTVYRFSFSKYLTTGEREIEIEGDSANILGHEIQLMNVIAKAYAEETPVVITADQGVYDKTSGVVHLNENVVATTDTGARLLTEKLDIVSEKKRMESSVLTNVKTENIDVVGTEAIGDSALSNVKFKKNVTVSFRNPQEAGMKPTVITCDGLLEIDYEKNIARFNDNVVAVDHRGTLKADHMDVIYDKATEQLDRMIGTGNVEIIKPDGSSTLSESVIYYAKEGRTVLGGDPEVTAYQSEDGAENPFDLAISSEHVESNKVTDPNPSPAAEDKSELPSFLTKGIA